MGLRKQLFDHQTPAPPTLAGGMQLDVSGVKHPALSFVGSLSAVGSGDGQFAALFGFGQMDYGPDGKLYVCDPGNQRIQAFTWNGVSWVFHSKCSAASFLTGAFNPTNLVVDRANNEIHISANNENVDSIWVRVFSLASWPLLTNANHVRRYGSNAAGSVVGKVVTGLGLTLCGNTAIAVSSGGDRRVVAWNHQTGAVVAEFAPTGTQYRYGSDGAKLFGGGQQTSGTLPGMNELNPATLALMARMDTVALDVAARWGVISNISSLLNLSDCAVFGGRVYGREPRNGRLLGWRISDRAYLDEFLHAGGEPSTVELVTGGLSGFGGVAADAHSWKFGFWGAPPNSGFSDYCLLWSANVAGAGSQSFLAAIPISVSTALWAKSDFSAGANVLKGFAFFGKDVASEKVKVEVQRNSEGWQTIPYESLGDEDAWAALGPFTQGNLLSLRVSSSVWDRLDGRPLVAATRDKIPPSRMRGVLLYDDPLSDIYVGEPTSSFSGDVLSDPLIEGVILQ